MEKLIWMALGAIVVSALLGGLICGALANLIGFGFWPVAGIAAAIILAFGLGRMAGG